MSKSYFVDQEYKGIDFSEKEIVKGDYENCVFNNCIFSGSNLTDFSFEDCEFLNCDFSMTKITNIAFRNVIFKDCKLIGLQFDECNPFLLELRFERCHLNYSSFYKLKIKKTRFLNCILQEVDFNECDLSESVFTECDFSGAMFGRTNLEKADFRTSKNFSINPETNKIKKAKFSLLEIAGLLSIYDIIIE